MRKIMTASIAALLLSSTAVLAQSTLSFESFDGDGDGKLAFEDISPTWPDVTREAFDSADMDSDDFLDPTQFEGLKGIISNAGGASTEVAAGGDVGPLTVDAPDFERLDGDGDGKLSFDDILPAWPGVTREAFDTADMNGDDFLDPTQYEGLKGVVTNMAGAATPLPAGSVAVDTAALPSFDSIDSDGDDQISFSDLVTVLPDVTQEAFDSADIDNDDFLDQTQYEALLS